jgi:hypothetical protein
MPKRKSKKSTKKVQKPRGLMSLFMRPKKKAKGYNVRKRNLAGNKSRRKIPRGSVVIAKNINGRVIQSPSGKRYVILSRGVITRAIRSRKLSTLRNYYRSKNVTILNSIPKTKGASKGVVPSGKGFTAGLERFLDRVSGRHVPPRKALPAPPSAYNKPLPIPPGGKPLPHLPRGPVIVEDVSSPSNYGRGGLSSAKPTITSPIAVPLPPLPHPPRYRGMNIPGIGKQEVSYFQGPFGSEERNY